MDGSYVEKAVQDKAGKLNSMTEATVLLTVQGVDMAHYAPQNFSQQKLTENGIVIEIKYNLNEYKLSYDTQGGSYVAPAYGKYGRSIVVTSTRPTKAGYTFEGWYTDKECTTKAGANITLGGNTTLYANWTPTEVKFIVTYWRQKLDGNYVGMPDKDKTYDFVESTEKTALAGTQIDPADYANKNTGKNGDFNGFVYNSVNSAKVTVNGDGTTIVNVYYDRVVCTVNYYVRSNRQWVISNPDGTVSGLFAAPFVKADGTSAWKTDYTWYRTATSYGGTSGSSSVLLASFDFRTASYNEYTIDPATGNHTLNFYGSRLDNDKYVYYYNEVGTDENGEPIFALRETISIGSGGLTIHSKFNGYELYKYHESSSKDNSDKTKNSYWNGKNNCIAGSSQSDSKYTYIASTLKKHTITYHSGNTVAKEIDNVKYTSPLNIYGEFIPENTANDNIPDGYTFEGWYKDDTFEEKFEFANEKMPNANLVVYAKWQAPTYTLTFNTNDGTVIERQTVVAGTAPKAPADPTKDGYIFKGWYDSSDNLYDFNKPLTEDTTIYAKWEDIAFINYTVKYVDESGNEVFPTVEKSFNITGTTIEEAVVRESALGHETLVPDAISKSLNLSKGREIQFVYKPAETLWYRAIYVDYATKAEIGREDFEVSLNHVVNQAPDLEGYEGINFRKSFYLAYEPTQASIKENVVVFEYKPIFVISAKGAQQTVTYNGSEQSAEGFTPTVTGKGDTTKFTVGTTIDAKATGTDAGTYYMGLKKDNITVTYGGPYTDENCVIRYGAVTDGYIKINPRKVVMTSATAQKDYDGKALTAKTVTATGFVGSDNATYDVTGSQTLPGTGDNTFTYRLNDGVNPDNYSIETVVGKLKVNPKVYNVTVTANSSTATYSNTTHSVSGLAGEVNGKVPVTVEGLDGLTYYVSGLTASASGVNAGTYDAIINGDAVVTDSDGNDVTAMFTVNKVNGKLTINKRKVVMTSASDSKKFDGVALTNGKVDATGFVGGDGATYNVTGSIVYPGSVKNLFAYKLNEGVIANNYEITTEYGILTVADRDAKYEITMQPNGGNVTYDGTRKSVSGFVTNEFTVEGNKYTVTGPVASATGTDAGEYPVTVTPGNFVVRDSANTDVTKQFLVKFGEAKLVIDARDVVLTSATDTKEYDGTPLTNHNVTAEGFVGNDGATYTVTGSQTLPGTSDNTFTYALKDGTKAANYNITQVAGKLTVTDRSQKYEVTVTANSGEFTYDGTTHTVSGLVNGDANNVVTVTAANNLTYTVHGLSATAGGKNADEDCAVKVTGIENVVVKDAQGNDVTKQFTVKTADGTLTINPVKITIKANSAEKPYDGKPLQDAGYTITAGKFVGDEEKDFNIKVTGSQTAIGSSANVVTVSIKMLSDLLNKASAENYEITPVNGTLEVTGRDTKWEITVTANSHEAKYDGIEKSVAGMTLINTDGTDGGAMENGKAKEFEIDGAKFTISGLSASAKGKDAGEYTANVTGTPVIKDSEGNDVTALFTVKTVPGKLDITKRTVKLTSATDEKEFDNTPLTNNTVTVTGDGFVEGEGATYNVTGSQTYVGNSPNTFTYALKSNTKEANYNIEKSEGTLTVVTRDAKYRITVVANSGTHKYDGTPFTVSGFETLTFDVDGHTYTVSGLTSELTKTDAVSTLIPIEGTPVVTNSEGKDVTKEFAVSTKQGTLTVQQRNVTLTSADGEKFYDGIPLTNDTVTVSGDGFAKGEGATYNVTGSQTKVGSSPNFFTYALDSNTKAENYNINLIEGTLNVKDNGGKLVINLTANSDEFKYDGGEKSVSGIVLDTGDGTAKVKVTENGDTLFTMPNGVQFILTGVSASEKQTNAGTYDVEIQGNPAIFSVVEGNKADNVTDQFAINPTDGKLVITKRDVILTSATDSREYNGKALTNDEVTVSGDGFATGEGAAYNVTGSQTKVGDSKNTFTYTLNGNTKAENYNIKQVEGVLSVTDRTNPYLITVEANSNVEPTNFYNGSAYKASGLKQNTFEIEGVTYTVTGLDAYAESVDAVKDKVVEVTGTATVTDPRGNNVTDQFTIKEIDGKLTVLPRKVVLTSGTSTKVYDGEPLTNNFVTATGFVGTDGATYNVTGSQTLVGDSKNTFTYAPEEGTNFANYEIETVFGTLTVTDGTENPPVPPTEPDPEKHVDPDKVIVKTAEGKEYKLGETVTFEIKVTNIYNEAKNITISEQEGVTITGKAKFENVAPGETVKTYAAYTVTEADIKAGTFKNIATAAFENGKTFSNDEDIDIEKPNPTLNITKETTSTPAENGKYALGETITYKITVTNTGNITLENVVVKDALTGDSWTIGSLAPNAAETFEPDYVVTEKDILAGEVVNVATATTTTPDTDVTNGEKVDPTEDPDGELTITKVTTSTPKGTAYALGEVIKYTITATNTGNLTLTEVIVTDTLTGDRWIAGTMAPGESKTFDTTYTVKEADVVAGHVLNEATATAKSPDPDKPEPDVTPGKEDEPVVSKDAKLFTEKKLVSVNGVAPADGVKVNLGDKLVYEIEVVNNGNVTVSAIEVTDPLTGDKWTVNALAPDAATTLTTKEYVVTEADILAGKVVNEITAKGTDPENKDVESETSVTTDTEDVNEHLTVNKVTTSKPANGKAYVLGETITYSITVTNDGNVTIKNATVTDELTGNVFTVKGDLVPGQTSEEFTDSYTVTEKDILNGSVVNVATAGGEGPVGPIPTPTPSTDPGATPTPKPTVDPDATPTPTPTPTPDVPVDKGETEDDTEEPNGKLTLTKTVTTTPANSTAYKVCEVIGYKIVARNDGNLTLTGTVVSDPLTGDSWTIETLAPGDEKEFTADYTVTEADAEKGSVTNTVTATSTSPDPDKPTPEIIPDEVETPVEPLYTLTIHYEYANGTTAAPDYVDKLHAGELFGPIYSPEITGYSVNYAFIRSSEYGMPAQDVEITVVYTQIVTPPVPPAVITDPTPTPRPTPEPPTGGEVEENEQGEVVIVPVVDPEVPLAETDLGHTCCILHFLIMVVAMLVLAFHTKRKKDHSEEIAKLRQELDARMIAKGLDVEIE